MRDAIKQGHGDQRGAALLLAMLGIALMFIVVTSMLSVVGNEIVIAGLHRDSSLAFEYAQSGVEEAVRRMTSGHPFQPGFSGSVGNVKVAVISLGSDLYEIRSQAVVGRAQRRISHLVELQTVAFPGDVFFGQAIDAKDAAWTPDAGVHSGDVYSRTFVKYREGEYGVDSSRARLTYAGWRIGACEDPEKAPTDACKLDEQPDKVAPCYTHAQCVSYGEPSWYPSTRRTESSATALGADIAGQKNKCPDGGGGSLPGVSVPAGAIDADGTDIGGQPLYGFDRDDRTWNGTAIAPQAVTGQLPCGLPYKWVSETFAWEKSDPPPTVTRWFKTIVFDQWFANYWTVDDEGRPAKNGKLQSYPEFGAIPAFPPVDTSVYDEKRTDCGQPECTLNESSGIDWGCKYPEMWDEDYPPSPYPPSWCTSMEDHPRRVVLEGGSWVINGNVKGHGTLVVTESLNFNIVSNFRYWGSILVESDSPVMLGSGNVKIHGGGLITNQKVTLGGNTLVEAGEGVPGAPTGLSIVVARAWWER